MFSRLPAALLVAVGGALGSLARWGVGQTMPDAWAVLAVNLGGCLLLGLLTGWLFEGRPRLRLLLGVGVLGGFTTFSTHLLAAQPMAPVPAAGYVVATLVGCVVLAAVGVRTGRSLRGDLR